MAHQLIALSLPEALEKAREADFDLVTVTKKKSGVHHVIQGEVEPYPWEQLVYSGPVKAS